MKAANLLKENAPVTYDWLFGIRDGEHVLGELMGWPFRSVVKTFQVRVWQDICDTWDGLNVEDQDSLKSVVLQWQLFEH
jgi:hypothetical protein